MVNVNAIMTTVIPAGYMYSFCGCTHAVSKLKVTLAQMHTIHEATWMSQNTACICDWYSGRTSQDMIEFRADGLAPLLAKSVLWACLLYYFLIECSLVYVLWKFR